jgi:hypothetical protein
MAAHFNEIDRALILEFGHGDLSIGSAHVEGQADDELVIWQTSPRPIGDRDLGDIGKTTVEVNTLVRMVFYDPCSLDVLIHQAQELRKLMVGEPWTADRHDEETGSVDAE